MTDNLIRKPFTATRTEEERSQDKSEVIGLKLNLEQRKRLEEIKELLDIGGDSQVIKLLMRIGSKVLLTHLEEQDLKYLVSRNRMRYDGRKQRDRRQFLGESKTDSLETVELSD